MKQREFYYFVMPSVIIMLALMVFPFFTAIYLGFNYITYTNVDAPEWVGFDNYRWVLQDAEFWDAMVFTIKYIVFTVPAQMVLGFCVALLLDQIKLFRGIYIAGALLPFIVTPVVGTLIFRHIFDRRGLYPYLLDHWFDYQHNFFLNDATLQPLIILHGIWYVTPFAMIVLFAGLQTLPKEPMEAAVVDGANWLQRIFYIVIPHLRSLFVFIALISIMDAYRIFDSIFVLTKQSSNIETKTIMYYNYQEALSYQRLGRANAMSVVTVVGIFIILIPFLYMTYQQQREQR